MLSPRRRSVPCLFSPTSRAPLGRRLHARRPTLNCAPPPYPPYRLAGFAFTGTAAAVFFVLSYVRNVKAEARMMYYAVTLINAITAIAVSFWCLPRAPPRRP